MANPTASSSVVPRSTSARRLPPEVRIALWYAGASGFYLFGSDWLLHHFVQDVIWKERLDNLSDGGFLVVTTLALVWGIRWQLQKLQQTSRKLQASEARLRLLDDNLPDTYEFQNVRGPDGKTRFSYVSAGVEQVHAVKVEDRLNPTKEKPSPRRRSKAATRWPILRWTCGSAGRMASGG